jgi:hypothetical protein
MSIEGDRSTSPSVTSGQPLPPPDDMGSGTRQQSGETAQTAKEAGQHVMSEMSDQVSNVTGTAKQQVNTLVGRAREEFTQQAEARGQQSISAVRSWGDQLQALVDGRPEGAGQLLDIVRDAQQRVQSYADSLERRGPRAFVDDVSRFARRRPAAFLLAVGFAGFAAGRLVRSGAQKDSPELGRGDDGYSSMPDRRTQMTRPFDDDTYLSGDIANPGGVVITASTP